MDVVYVVGPNPDRNEELRFSLRSLVNLPHDRVWIAGCCPSWARNVTHIPVEQWAPRKWINETANLRAACEHPDVSDPFVFFNDDFFVMQPIEAVPTLHRGPLRLTRPAGSHGQGARKAAQILDELGYADPVSYELHIPIIVSKAAMLEAIGWCERTPAASTHRRTVYGALADIGGVQADDVKVHAMHGSWDESAFLSTTNANFDSGDVGRHIRAQFPHPSPYEENPRMSEIEELRAHAERLGIAVDGRWGAARLEQEIADHTDGGEPEPTEADLEPDVVDEPADDVRIDIATVSEETAPPEPEPAPVPDRPLTKVRYWRNVDTGKRRNTTRGSRLDVWYEDSPLWIEE